MVGFIESYVSIRQHTDVTARNLMMRSRMNEWLALLNIESGIKDLMRVKQRINAMHARGASTVSVG